MALHRQGRSIETDGKSGRIRFAVLEPLPGIEPGTYGLRNRCSTPELKWQITKGRGRLSQVGGHVNEVVRIGHAFGGPLRVRCLPMIDLRSDTVTKPSLAMRAVMAAAEVGDDVFGDDPGARALEEKVAALFGKEAAIFVPSGTMGNQISLLLHCRPGDEVIVGEGAHCMFYESGAGAAIGGVQFMVAGQGGLFSADDVDRLARPVSFRSPLSRLVAVENTHNRAGGKIFPQAEIVRIAERARAHKLGVHLDGARIWNAHVATQISLAELAAPFDTVSVCFSKGLGAPIGSAILCSREMRERAVRYRNMLGGAMRQIGLLCAAANYAIDHNLERLATDHENARILAAKIANVPGLRCDISSVETNIVNIDTDKPADLWVQALRKEGVMMNASARNRLRAVTHLDVSRGEIEKACEAFARAVA